MASNYTNSRVAFLYKQCCQTSRSLKLLYYYRKLKPILTGAKLLLVTTFRRKQYGVVLQNDSTMRVYRNFEAFPSGGLNRCFGNKKSKIFSSFLGGIFVNFVEISLLKTFGKLRI